MEKSEFDSFADEYYNQHQANIAITGENPEYFAEYKIKIVNSLCAENEVGSERILDFGSGIGNSIAYFHRHMPNSKLICADVSRRSLDLAETRFAGLSQPLLIEEQHIPVDDDTVDVTFSACVFHHIPHEEHVHWLSELHRVTKPGGMLVIFEHNPLNPLTVRAVNTCPFDINAKLIRAGAFKAAYKQAGWRDPAVRYHLFFPRLLSSLRFLEKRLSSFPLGAQYSISALKHP